MPILARLAGVLWVAVCLYGVWRALGLAFAIRAFGHGHDESPFRHISSSPATWQSVPPCASSAATRVVSLWHFASARFVDCCRPPRRSIFATLMRNCAGGSLRCSARPSHREGICLPPALPSG